MARRTLAAAIVVLLALVAGWVLFVGLPRWYGSKPAPAAATTPRPGTQPATDGAAAERKITATLYYVSEDGMSLAPAQREVAFGATVAEQARAIVEAQLAPAGSLVSAIPAETRLRQLYVTEHGDAFVDLSPEVASRHPGGSLAEMLTVYTIVNALTVNLPAVTRVQILVDGKEVDTLAGHADLRHPLAKNLDWVVHDTH
jgi:spore germination protein GerM